MPWHTSAITTHFFPLFWSDVGVRFVHLRVAHCATEDYGGCSWLGIFNGCNFTSALTWEGDGGYDYDYAA
jgi:hypothetical protein